MFFFVVGVNRYIWRNDGWMGVFDGYLECCNEMGWWISVEDGNSVGRIKQVGIDSKCSGNEKIETHFFSTYCMVLRVVRCLDIGLGDSSWLNF